MRTRAALRPLVRAGRRAPGYRAVRRRVLAVLRGGASGRELARRIYPDLVDRQEARAGTERAQRAGKVVLTAERRRAGAREERLRVQLEAQHSRERQQWEAQQEHLRETQRRAVPAISAGTLVDGLLLGERPLLLLDVRGMDRAHAAELLDEVAAEQVINCGFRPLFVTDLDDPEVLRRYGHAVEILPGPQDWSSGLPYADYVAGRLETIRREYDARWYLTVAPSGLSGEQRAHLRRFGR